MSRTFFAFLQLFSSMHQKFINKPVMLPLKMVFIVGAITFAAFTSYFYYQSFKSIKRIKDSGAVKSLRSTEHEENRESTKQATKAINKDTKLEIMKAEYWTPNKRLDVTKEIRNMAIDNKLDIVANNDIKHDPDKGTRKTLTIEYKFDGIRITKEVKEREKLIIP